MYPEPDPEPDTVSGNVTDCYICGRNFVALSKHLRECVVKLEHRYKIRDAKGIERVRAYFISLCVWCHHAHCQR